jgi:carboxymethylenebutenolidase
MPNSVISAPVGELPVYAAVPSGTGPWPGVVVVYDALGMTREVQSQADWLAREGYLAAVPDLFHGRNKVTCMIAVMREARARRGRSFDDIEATRAWLAGRTDCTGTVGIIGFCMGGGLALLAAPGRGFASASVNYGTAPKDAYTPEFLAGACPIVGSFGGRDLVLRGAAGRLDRALTAVGVEHDVKEYPDAGHGFINDYDRSGDRTPFLVAVFAKLTPGMGYDENAARDARERILAFFGAHLKDGASA